MTLKPRTEGPHNVLNRAHVQTILQIARDTPNPGAFIRQYTQRAHDNLLALKAPALVTERGMTYWREAVLQAGFVLEAPVEAAQPPQAPGVPESAPESLTTAVNHAAAALIREASDTLVFRGMKVPDQGAMLVPAWRAEVLDTGVVFNLSFKLHEISPMKCGEDLMFKGANGQAVTCVVTRVVPNFRLVPPSQRGQWRGEEAIFGETRVTLWLWAAKHVSGTPVRAWLNHSVHGKGRDIWAMKTHMT